MTVQASRVAPTRLTALDGIRGIAALVVVFTHLNGISYLYTRPIPNGDPGTWVLWGSQTLVLASGTQAVYVFFLLSGIVITLPALGTNAYDWFGYFPRRLVRLYVPVAASLVLAAALVLLVARNPSQVRPEGWFSQANASSFGIGDFLKELTLMGGAYPLNGPLWSLRWEVLFSVQLPLFVVLAILARRWWPIAIVACLAISAFGAYVNFGVLVYMPMFLIGAIIAVNLARIQQLAARIHESRVGWLTTAGTLVLSAALLCSRVLLPESVQLHQWVIAATGTGWLVACVLLVLLAITSPTCARVLSTPVPQWLGKISFSLYLVHLPILATLTYIFGDARWYLVIAVGLPLVIACGYLFYRFVERPSHRFSHRVGGWGSAAKVRWDAQRHPTAAGIQ